MLGEPMVCTCTCVAQLISLNIHPQQECRVKCSNTQLNTEISLSKLKIF